jgi:uncharacterized membrane protein YfcA
MLIFIIVILSTIHSIFGIGLLAIGTPLLLLLGYDFLIILKILLPCSILISTLQVIKTYISYKDKKFIWISLPFVFLGALIIYFFNSNVNFKLFIGLSILFILFLKFFLTTKMNSLIKKNKIILISFTGFFHGLTNTGGSLVSLIFQGLKKNKYDIQKCIAYTYLFYALIQYFLLILFLDKSLLDYYNFELLLFTYIGYFIGNKIFKKIKFIYFSNILNFIIFLSAIYLIFSELKKYLT